MHKTKKLFFEAIVWDADPACGPQCTQQTDAWDFNHGDNLDSVSGSDNPSNTGTNGPGNTWQISNILNGHNGNMNNPANYAAGVCISYAGGDHPDWYLPALCEMGIGANCPAGTQQNIVENLSILLSSDDDPCAISGNCLYGHYWSSTEVSLLPLFAVWRQTFVAGSSYQDIIGKNDSSGGVRCVRALTI